MIIIDNNQYFIRYDNDNFEMVFNKNNNHLSTFVENEETGDIEVNANNFKNIKEGILEDWQHFGYKPTENDLRYFELIQDYLVSPHNPK